MIKRTIEFLGILASVMALCSAIYGAFHESLYPNMQGIMGGVLEVYRTMRDLVFVGLGWTFSGGINLFAQWLTWLPPAPWFSLSPFLKDIAAMYVIIGSAVRQTYIAAFNISEDTRRRVVFRNTESQPNFIKSIGVLLLWPIFLFEIYWDGRAWNKEVKRYKELLNKVNREGGTPYYEGLVRKELAAKYWQKLTTAFHFSFAATLLGAAGFFLLVYAENRIGL